MAVDASQETRAPIGYLSRHRHSGFLSVRPGEIETPRPYVSIRVGSGAELQLPVDDLAQLNVFLRELKAAITEVRAR